MPGRLTGLLMLLIIAGCADSADKISASYVSPLVYQDYTCQQLGAEVGRVTARAQEVAGVQDDASSDDAAIMGIGLVLFWPSLFFLEGDTGREAELARLKGELDAIEQIAVRKDCSTVITDLSNRRARAAAKREEAKAAAKAAKCESDPSSC